MSLLVAVALSMLQLSVSIPESSAGCVECHRQERIAAASLRMWEESSHAEAGVACAHCHLTDPSHQGLSLCARPGVQRAVPVAVCAGCHAEESTGFEAGGHALAWLDLERVRRKLTGEAAALSATRGCETCHRIGENGGRCDFCHTRHRFDPAEARRPEACRPCHQGDNHPEWATYSLSRHGSIHASDGAAWSWSQPLAQLYGDHAAQEEGSPRAPVCAACHMPAGAHGVRSAADPLLLDFAREDPDWAGDQLLIRRHFEAPGRSVPGVEAAPGPARPTVGLDALVPTCAGCHTRSYAAARFEEARATIREADRLTAAGVRLVEGLQTDGLVPTPEVKAWSPDLLGLLDPGSSVEERLWAMVLVHRVRLVHGVFHQNPDYQQRLGWRELRGDFDAIAAEAKALRAAAATSD